MTIIDTHLADIVELSHSASEDAFAAKVAEITDSIAAGAPTSEPQRRRLLTTVRSRRAFPALAKLCEALTWAGHDTPVLPDGKGGAMRNPAYDPRVRQEMIQAMVDQGQLIQALDVVDQHRRRIESLGAGEGPPAERDLAYAWGQACGLAGRIHKQIYVDNAERDTTARFEEHLRHAICWYGLPFRRVEGDRIRCDETRDDEWHAINFVALLHRAEKDGVAIPAESAKGRAAELVAALQGKIAALEAAGKSVGAWTWASLGEAHVALGEWEQARVAYERYAEHNDADTFALFGSLRQLIEVWRLDGSEGGETGQAILDTLGEQIGKRGKRDGQTGDFTVQESMSDDGESTFQLAIRNPRTQQNETLQSRNADVLQSVAMKIGDLPTRKVLRSARVLGAVGRVFDDDEGKTFGTGFVVRAGELLPGLGERLLFLTNSHVISEGSPDALHRRNARVQFDREDVGLHQSTIFGVKAVVWESPEAFHDACLVALTPAAPWLTPVTLAAEGALATRHEEIPASDQRCYVVGFAGDAASRVVNSFAGLQILDVGPTHASDPRAPECLHYTNLTMKGDSGGPVCNGAWHVIALHRAGAVAGGAKLRALNGRNGMVAHAEGVMIRSLRKAMQADRAQIEKRLAELDAADRGVDGGGHAPLEGAAGVIRATDAAERLLDLLRADAVAAEEVDGVLQSAILVEREEVEPEHVPPMGPDIRLPESTRQRAVTGGITDTGIVLASRLGRRARNTGFETRVAAGATGRRIVSDGDSWFQYPWPGVEDTIDQLINRHGYLVSCGALAGETLQTRIADSETAERIKSVRPEAILISGGGNDMLGNGAIVSFLKPFEGGMSAGDVIEAEQLANTIEFLVGLHRQWIARIRRVEAYAPIFTHGYDWATPKRKRGWWLNMPLSRHGITDGKLQRDIVRHVIDRFSERMQAMTKAADNVHFVDCRGAVGTGAHWMDELHPTNDGFARVAACFHAAIVKVLGPAPK